MSFPRSVDHVFAPDAFSVIGGARAGWSSATFPLAKLELDDQWAHIDLRVAEVWIRRDEVWQVRRCGRGEVVFDNRDLLFDTVVWFSSPSPVLAAFSRAGWPVEPPSGPLTHAPRT